MRAVAAIVMALSGAVVAVAAPAPGLSFDANAQTPVLQPETVGGIEVMNGGVSDAEAAHIKAQASRYPLQVLITGRGGEYGVADQLTVRDGPREIVSVPDAGPFVLMKLPPGRYTVEADFDGEYERRNVTIGSGVTRLHWNTPKVSD